MTPSPECDFNSLVLVSKSTFYFVLLQCLNSMLEGVGKQNDRSGPFSTDLWQKTTGKGKERFPCTDSCSDPPRTFEACFVQYAEAYPRLQELVQALRRVPSINNIRIASLKERGQQSYCANPVYGPKLSNKLSHSGTF